MTKQAVLAPLDLWPQIKIDSTRPPGGEELRRWNRRKEVQERTGFLLSTLENEWPELTAKSPPVEPIPILKAELDRLLELIKTRKLAAYPDLHAMLRAGLNRGARLGWFSGDIPQPLIRVKSAGSPVKSSNFAQVARVSLLRQKFIAGISASLEGRETAVLAGATLISAVIFGQVYDRAKLRTLSRMKLSIKYVRPWLWLDFASDRETSQEGRRGGASKRWIIDSLTANLLLRWLAKNNDTPLIPAGPDLDNKRLDRMIWSVVGPVLEMLDPGITSGAKDSRTDALTESVPGDITSVTKLAEFAALSNYLHGAPLLTEVAAGRLENYSLPEHAWLRVITGKRLGPAQMPDPEKTGAIKPNAVESGRALAESTHPATRELRQRQYKLLSGFKRILREAKKEGGKQKSEARKAIQKFIECNRQDIGPVLLLLLQWGDHRLGKAGGGIKPSALDRYLVAIGTPFIDFFGTREPSSLADEDFIDVYESVRDSGKTSAEMKLRADLCSAFHQWLEGQGLVTRLDVAGEIGGAPGKDKNVDANILTFGEYLETLQRLQAKKAKGMPYCDQAMLLTTLGYRLGLRLSEMFGLRKAHFSIAGDQKSGDLFIHAGKTANAKRILPFVKLMPFKEEKQHLLTALKKLTKDDWLLHEPGSQTEPANQAKVIDLVVTTMREATGDGSVHIHHLRHSHITWIYFTLLPSVDCLGRLLAAWEQNALDDKALFQRQRSLLMEEIGYGSTTRKTPYAIAIDAGHAAPDIGLYSYAHLIDVALFAEGERKLKRLMTPERTRTFLGISEGNLRVIRSRLNPRDDLELLVLHGIKNLPRSARHKLQPDLSGFPEWEPPPPVSRLAMISAALMEIDAGTSLEMVERQYGFPGQDLAQWRKSAIKMAETLEGQRGGKHLAASDKPRKHPLPVYRRKLSRKEWHLAEQVHERLHAEMQGPEKEWAASMVKIAMKQGFGGHNLLLFNDPIVAADFIRFAKTLGIDEDQLILELRPHRPDSESDVENDLVTWCGALNIDKERVLINAHGYSGLSKLHGDLGIQVASADWPNDGKTCTSDTKSARRYEGGAGFWTAIRFYNVFNSIECMPRPKAEP